MKILLVCAAGMSTSMLVNNMKKEASESDIIEARPEGKLNDYIDDFDVVLVGPQIRYKLPEIETICKEHGKVCGLLDMRAYGQMDGKVAYNQAKSLLK